MYMLQGLYGTRICIMRYFNFKADVYSFGVVVLEIVAGENNRKHGPNENPACLLDWVRYILPMFY